MLVVVDDVIANSRALQQGCPLMSNLLVDLKLSLAPQELNQKGTTLRLLDLEVYVINFLNLVVDLH